MKQILVATLVLLAGCQSQEPLGAPDVVGTIELVNIADERINYLVLHSVSLPSGYERIQISITPKTKVRWYSSGDEVHSHQLIVRGMQVYAYTSGGIADGTPPVVSVKRVDIAARRQ